MSTGLLLPLFETIYGPMYFSVVLSTAFYGVTCMQTFVYYVNYQDDSSGMKSFVAVLWALDTIHEALTIAGVYKYIIAGLANPLAILNVVPEIVLQILPLTAVSMCAQAYFVYRIYVFSGRNIVAPILWVIQAIYQIAATIVYVAKSTYSADGIHLVNYIVLDDHFFTSLTAACFAITATVDVLIAIAMTFLLLRKRNATGFANTTHILQRLIMFAVNTGIWTATFAVLSFILLRAFPETSYYVAFATPLSSLYCNTLLANLNARAYIRGGITPHGGSAEPVMMINPPLFIDSKTDKQGRETSSTQQSTLKTTEMVSFIDITRSPTSEIV